MSRLFYPLMEALLAAAILLPVLLIWNRRGGRPLKTMALYLLFSMYLGAVYSLTGLPNIGYLRFDPNIQWIPFSAMGNSPGDSLLNAALFMPLGFFLCVLWQRFRRPRNAAFCGFFLSLLVEGMQMFSFRTTDISDLITNTLGTLLGCCLGLMVCRAFPRLKEENRNRDLPVLLGLTGAVMFLFQPLFWNILY